MDLPAEVYEGLLAGAFNSDWGYAAFNLDDPERYYYRRVYLGCVRANDFLVAHPIFQDEKDGHRTPAKMRTAALYDVVNFARRVKAPGLYSWGWNDEVCPPTSTYAAYDVITAPKELLLALETGHFTVPEQTEEVDRWIESQVR